MLLTGLALFAIALFGGVALEILGIKPSRI